MTPADALKAAGLLFAGAILQVSIVASVDIARGTPDLLLVALLCVALLRGSIVGAVGGFFAGLLFDTATLGTLGLSSLVFTVSGYWIGRYGETTGRDRGHAPYLSVAVVTVLATLGGLVLHFMLGEDVAARQVLEALPATVVLNVLLTGPVYALVRRALRGLELADRTREVRLLG